MQLVELDLKCRAVKVEFVSILKVSLQENVHKIG